MISVDSALQIVLKATQDFGVEEVPFLASVGSVLKEDIVADRDFPPFNRVTMDGIAIAHDVFVSGKKTFPIEGIQAAGSPQIDLQNKHNCIEVMTGAVLPNHTDTVIRYEDIMIDNGVATLQTLNITKHQNIHQQGKDTTKGTRLIPKNTKISAAEIGLLATVGKVFVKVAKLPKVMIVSTGDELVAVEESPLAHQIRRSNVFTLVSLLENFKIASETTHIPDDKIVLKAKIKTYLETYDVLLFSGAVSKGKYDFLPEVLDELGVQKQFHKVAQRPGKPFWFGNTASCCVFAFPGNPVSTFVNCLVYFYPWYQKSVGIEIKEETAILNEDVIFKPNLQYFMQVALTNRIGHTIATPVDGNGSGDLVSLTAADGYIVLPAEEVLFKKGSAYKLIRFR